MRMSMICSQCAVEAASKGEPLMLKKYVMDVNDGGVYEFVCDHGHYNKATLQNWKFEVLYDMGVKAFRDGYYREAVVNFAAALERFYEYAIRFFCYIQEIDVEKVDVMWKDVSSQSERQLGAYCFLYLLAMKENPCILKGKAVEFRNSVVHKGFIPKREEALDYGEKVHAYIRKNIILIQQNFDEKVNEYKRMYFLSIRKDDTSGLGLHSPFLFESLEDCLNKMV